jgi:regulatory protein
LGKITALRLNAQKKQVSIFIDGLFSLTVSDELAETNHLKVGGELSSSQIEQLKKASLFHNCMDAAVRYLSYRPRSENEIRQRLRRRGFEVTVIDEVASELKERKLIDDVAFSEFWLNNRLSFSPRSARLIKLELRQKGVSTETAAEVVDSLDDENAAYKAGLRKARRWADLDHDGFYHSLYDYLRRRGFNYEIIKRSTERLWRERKSGSL